ncbi:Riboflavin transporter MCH5 [Tolypocladium ophioglossoides CBS 100239]|uniref:Riboflavin transporter MCH5 n=1 Tax=Tolypocladium ophioglossoides (strain CBS 100239) TaxID=1163406 RepID=A0A0L0NA98_TOLOC|nr:Riboflavin transporter MCH5 [Tolypocladium ophioglossoides CBS 100239]
MADIENPNPAATESDSAETAPKEDAKPTMQFPEGGLRAWLVVLGGFCVSFSTFGYMNTYGVFQDYYSRHFLSDKSQSSISWIGSIQVFFLYAGGVVGGPLFDRYGARVIPVPGFMAVFAIMMTSLCTKYYQFMLAQGILGGMASGMLFAPAMTCVSHYFHRRRAAALGLTVTGSSIGGVIFPIALSRMLQNESLGFGWSVRIVGFIILATMLIAMFTLKERLPPRGGKIILLSAFRKVPYTVVILGIFFLTLGLFTPFFYLPQFAQQHGMGQDLASYLLAILNAASIFGRVLPGVIADKLGRYNTLIIKGACSGVLLLCWPAITSNASTIIFAILYGFFSGGIVSLMSPCIAQVTPHANQLGTYLGMAMTILGIAGLTGTPICGALLQSGGSFTHPAIFSGVVMLFGVLLVAVARCYQSVKLLAKV